MEIWRDIPNYEGLYQASNSGFIRSVEGKVTNSKKFKMRRWKSRVLKGRGNNPITGKRVSLWKNGSPKDFLVARLVAVTFLGVPPEGFTVNHKDGNRMNNNIENLEWLSLADNIRHGFETGLYRFQKPITIIRVNDNEIFKFRSRACSDRFLNRSNGYTSSRLNKNCFALTDANGDRYKVIANH